MTWSNETKTSGLEALHTSDIAIDLWKSFFSPIHFHGKRNQFVQTLTSRMLRYFSKHCHQQHLLYITNQFRQYSRHPRHPRHARHPRHTQVSPRTRLSRPCTTRRLSRPNSCFGNNILMKVIKPQIWRRGNQSLCRNSLPFMTRRINRPNWCCSMITTRSTRLVSLGGRGGSHF